VVAMAGARLIELLTEKRQRLLLIALFVLIVLQFSVSRATRLSPDPLAIAAMVRPLRVGLVWAAAAAFVLRRELGERAASGAAWVRPVTAHAADVTDV